jgi:hypothetical protein
MANNNLVFQPFVLLRNTKKGTIDIQAIASMLKVKCEAVMVMMPIGRYQAGFIFVRPLFKFCPDGFNVFIISRI